MQQDHLPRIHFDGDQSLLLESPHWINEGVLLEELHLQMPTYPNLPRHTPKLLRNTLRHLRCRFDRRYLTALISRTLSGGGLSDLQVRSQQARVEISGLLSREGRRTPFLARGFLSETAGPYGGAVFYDLRLFGRPGLPAPALISLLTARTGRHGPIQVRGAVTLQFDLLSLLLKYGLCSAGWKIPSFRNIQLQQLEIIDDSISLLYQDNQGTQAFPLAQHDPMYPFWTELIKAEHIFLEAEEAIGKGDYKSALQAYSEELWRYPGHPFLQERLMQLYIASPQQELWTKAYHIAEELLQRSRQAPAAINCLAQYFEGTHDYPTAAHYYTKLGEYARAQNEHVEAALSFGKAAELLESMDANRAKTLWQMAREEDKAYRPAIAALARHALKTGIYHEAEEILRDLIAQTPPSIERARYHLSLAGLYRSRLRDLSNARQQLDFAAPYLGEDIAYLRELAEFRLATDENIDALRILDKLSERVKLLNQPSLYADLLFRTGQILEERLGRPGQALSRYRETLKARPEHPHAQHRLSTLQAANVREETFITGAFDDLNLIIEEKLRTLQTGNFSSLEAAQLQFEIARLYWQQNDADSAFTYGQEALKLHANLEDVWEFLEEVGLHSARQVELAAIHRNLASAALFPHDAVQHLEKALRLNPQDTDTLQLLSQHYQNMQQWEKLDILYSRWLEVVPPHEATALWQQKAQIQEYQLQQLDDAERSYVQAFQSNPGLPEPREQLVQFYARNQLWDKLSRQLSHLSQSLNPQEQAALYAEKGRQLLAHSRTTQALDAYQKALLLDPENPELLRPTIDLLRQTNGIAALVPLLKRIAEITQSPEEEVAFRNELAELLETRLSERQAALTEYQRVVALSPTQQTALERIARLSEALSLPRDAADAYTKLLPLYEGNSPQALHAHEQLTLLYDKLQEPQKLQKHAAQILKIKPDYGQLEAQQQNFFEAKTPKLLQARVLLLLGHTHHQVGLILQAVQFLQSDHPQEALSCLEMGLQLSPLHPELWHYRLTQATPEARIPLWKTLEQHATATPPNDEQKAQLHTLFDLLQHENLSLDEVQSLYDTFQGKQLLIFPLCQLYATMLEREDQLERALEVRTQLLEQLDPGPEKNNLRFELAIQQIRLLNDRENGLSQLWTLLREQPDHTDAFYELQQLYEEDDAIDAFVTQLEELAIQTPPGASRADLCIRVFEFYRDLLSDEEKANQFLAQASEADDAMTLQAIAAAYEASAAFQQAAELYTRLADISEDSSTRLYSLERAGEIYQKELDAPDLAIQLFQSILDRDPTHTGAIEQLKNIYETLWMWEEYTGLLELQAIHASNQVEAAEYFRDMGEIFLGRLEDYDRALSLYRRSLRNHPRSLKVLQALQALYEELSDWPAVVAALKAMSRNEANPDRLSELHMQIAALSFERLQRIEESEKHYQLAHVQKPENAEPLERLIALYEATDDRISSARTAAQLAILYAKKDNANSSKEALRKLIAATEYVPGSQGPEGLLRQLLQERQESAKLTRTIFELLGELSSHETLSPIFFIAGELYQKQLQELSWLLRLWESEQEVLTEEQADTIVDAVQTQDWDAVHQVLLDLLKDFDSNEDKASISLAIAEVALHQRKHQKDAETYAKEALTMGAPPERSMRIFEILQQQNQGNLKLDSLLDLAKELTHPDELSRVLFHLGSIFLLEQEDFASCLQSMIEASMLSPTPLKVGGSLQFLQQLKTSLQNDQDTPKTLPEGLPPLGHCLLNAWIAFASQRRNEGVAALEEALTIEPNCSAALRILGYHYTQVKNVERAAFCYFRFLELEWENLPFDEVVEVCLQLAQLYAQQESWDNSLFYLEQAHKFVPEEPRIFISQTQVLKQAGYWEELKQLYQRHIEAPELTDDVAELWYHLGQLHAVHLQNADEAQLCYQRALQINPMHTASLQELEELVQFANENPLGTL